MHKERELFDGGFMQSVISGMPFSQDDWREHLEAFHAQVPSATPSAMLKMLDERGRTSYEALAQAVSQHLPVNAKVLDVGCGDGEFVRHLRARLPESSVVGVDISTEEIARARARFDDGKTDFYRTKAEQLPFGDGTFDGVVSHMALMLIPSLDRALGEVRRVLRPGGTLAFIVNAASIRDRGYNAFVSRAHAFMRDTFRSYKFTPLAGGDLLTAQSIRSHIRRAERFANDHVEIHPICVSANVSVDELLEFLLTTYVFAALSGAHRQAFIATIRDEFDRQRDAQDRVRLEIPLHLVLAR